MKISLNNGRFLPVIFIITIYLSAQILFPILSIRLFSISNLDLLRILTIGYQILAIVIIVIFTKKVVVNSIDLNQNRFSFFKSIGYGINIFLIIMVLQVILGIIMQIFAYFLEFNPQSENTSEIAKIVKQQPVFMIFVIILAPILEEFVFRKAVFGYLYDILAENKEKLRFLIASTLTGLVFALPHDGLSPIAIVYVVMSMIFSYAYRKSANILVPIVAHMLMNAVVIISQYYMG